MKANPERRHKNECKQLGRFLIALKKQLVDPLSNDQTALLKYDFSTADTCGLGTMGKTWAEYAEQAEVQVSELPVILSVNEVFFNKTRNPDLELWLHLPMTIRSPHAAAQQRQQEGPKCGRTQPRGSTTIPVQRQVTVQKPDPKPKKRKVEETLLGPDTLDSDCVGEADAEKGEIVAETPLPMPEAAEPPVPRLTRAKRTEKEQRA